MIYGLCLEYNGLISLYRKYMLNKMIYQNYLSNFLLVEIFLGPLKTKHKPKNPSIVGA